MADKNIGIYSINAAGKTNILKGLKENHLTNFNIYEGSEVITRNITLENFKKLDNENKSKIRREALKWLKDSPGNKIVAGHFSFPSFNNREISFEKVWTDFDGNFYTDIIYIDVPPSEIYIRQKADILLRSDRPFLELEHIKKWLEYEKKELELECINLGIKFYIFKSLLDKNSDNEMLLQIIENISKQTEKNNATNIEISIKKFASTLGNEPKCFILIDGDRTLCENDTGIMFWKLYEKYYSSSNTCNNDFKTIFKNHGHSYFAFLQVAYKYSGLDSRVYNNICTKVIKETKLYPQFLNFLKIIFSSYSQEIIPIVIVSGIVEIWHNLLYQHFGNKIPLFGGNLFPNDEKYVMDAKSKGHCAKLLKSIYPKSKIIAFGDSEVDLEMLTEADESYLVVDYTNNRALRQRLKEQKYIDLKKKLRMISFFNIANGNKAENDEIPITTLDEIIYNLVYPSNLYEYTSSHASRIIATFSRHKEISGINLCNVHENIGYFMASKVIEKFEIISKSLNHVQGCTVTNGFALENEEKIGIIVMMRAGDSMAKGVWKFMPKASYIHHQVNKDIDKYINHFEKLILVDSVINEGKTMRSILNYIVSDYKFQGKIFVITGVIQDVTARKLPREFPEVSFYALRVSKNKYKGIGDTDTGNRLYNTTIVA
ncbi:1288_t:CDS:1 [Diversispora eburnea]|uniref:1288_t:CDS:1 n=1 Tax=Diversispora eburnea TaxID=1213867 RepID=A0A9N9AI48_9GLOM|nr:1288_t:CDS:1 [Diversispora eburnea]